MMHVYEKLRAVEFYRLAKTVRKVYLSPPALSVPVVPHGDGFRLSSPATLDRVADQALVPKLGIKSWRDSGRLGVIYEGVNIRSIADPLLQRPTAPQRLAARAWTEAGLTFRLHLSPYVDFSAVTEVRFLVNPRECRRIGACLRGQSTQSFGAILPQMTAFAANIKVHLPPHSHILDIAYLPNGDIRLVEINPGLTPQDLYALENS